MKRGARFLMFASCASRWSLMQLEVNTPCFPDIVAITLTVPGTLIYPDNAILRYFLLSSFWIYIILRELLESRRYVDTFAKLSSPLFIRLNRCPTLCLDLVGF